MFPQHGGAQPPAPAPWRAPRPYPPPQLAPFMGPPYPYPYYPAAAAPPPHHYAAAVFGHPVPMPVPAHLQAVKSANFRSELDAIRSLLPRYPYVVVDTEYPGTVHRPPAGRREADLTPDERYALIKANVDELPLVQLGLTLCDAQGNTPPPPAPHPAFFGAAAATVHAQRAWEVTFWDFNAARHRHAAESVAFLRSQGVDLDAARLRGVSAAAFGFHLADVLRAARRDGRQLTWVAFGGAYDLAYLVKLLTAGLPLPDTRQEFLARVREVLGGRVFDAKVMAENCGRSDLRGVGLRSVAANLGVQPVVDLPYSAGAKSLTACRIHAVMKTHVLSPDAAAGFEGMIDGLQ